MRGGVTPDPPASGQPGQDASDVLTDPMPDVRNRMVVAVLALLGVLISTYLLLYKLGAFGTILCGTGGCEVVQNSPWAFFLGVPVAGWGLAGYLAILVVALMGAQPRFAAAGWVAASLLLLTGGAFLFSGYLTLLEAFVIHAWCQWCVVSAVLATLAFAFSLPEAGRVRA